MSDAARLLFPAVRWDPERAAWDMADRIDGFLELGVGGFIVFGGPTEAAAELTTRLRSGSRHPILVGADLERGAGQQFEGATPLPPAAALASLEDPSVTHRAGALTGREARALGVDWAYAPVADVDVEPANPIVGTRAFGTDPEAAARHVGAWVEGCRSAGALSCAKHFPGHGRTTVDSHLVLPAVDADRATLVAELEPFRSAIEAGVDAIMTAHVAFPALDPSGAPATLSGPILDGLLRDRLGFDGVVVTDALIMEGLTGGVDGGVEAAAVRAVAAGCDALLYPPDPHAVAAGLEAARGRELAAARIDGAVARIGRLAARVDGDAAGGEAGGTRAVGAAADRAWALRLATVAVHVIRGDAALAGPFELVTVDDDVGGPYPAPSRSAFPETLRKAGAAVIPVESPTGGRPVVVAVHADTRGFKGRPGLREAASRRLRAAVEAAPASLVVLFGHPRLAGDLPGENVLCAWGGEPLMQEAAAVRLARGAV
ncbi:MAG: glycoside hydrolase family 3 N-terminal domain-containing protein [Candidatus Longimicrobiales bacterium M2_2A_002]